MLLAGSEIEHLRLHYILIGGKHGHERLLAVGIESGNRAHAAYKTIDSDGHLKGQCDYAA